MYCKVNRGDVTYTIRPMIVADCENVAGLFNAYLPADKQVDRDSLEIILIRQEYQGLVMTKPVEPGGESIVGAMMLQVGPGYRYIMSMTIEKAHRRQGLASAMIDLLKQVAVDYSLSLHVDAVTPEAFMLFQSRGFQKNKKEH